ncbi:MAG: GAF domain-containing protein [Kastovskya adunca ATA6-11-RM4]|jgi:PAS domain S-box-containing protein|nr:GAF domain-containing protein [Kastovskya adunca ATA6-11-RM4]
MLATGKPVDVDELEQQIKSSQRRLDEMLQGAEHLPPCQRQSLMKTLLELTQTIQKMQSTSEELRSNQELQTTRLVVEAERSHYQELFTFAPDAYLVTDTKALILEANPAATELLQTKQEFLIGKPLSLYVIESARQDFRQRVLALQGGEKVSAWEILLRRQPGQLVPVEVTVALIQDFDRQVNRLCWRLQDITERQRYTELESDRYCLEHQLTEQTAVMIAANQWVRQESAERQQAEAALQQHLQKERLVRDIQGRIRASLNLVEVLNTTVVETRQFLQADRVAVYQIESDSSGMVVAESVAKEWSAIAGSRVDAAWFKESIALYREGNPSAIDDMTQLSFPEEVVEFLQQQQIQAGLAVPIAYKGHFWGVLIAHQCSAPRHWQSAELDLLMQLADQVAIAIHQSELHQKLTQVNADLERQVEERTAELRRALEAEAILKRITDKVRDSLDENQSLQTAVQELTQGLKIYGCDTTLYDLEQQVATIAFKTTSSGSTPQGDITISMSDYPEEFDQLLQGQHFQFCKLLPDSWGSVAIFACPIFDNQGVLGDLWLFKQKRAAFQDWEIRLVLQVANQLAIAIRQSRLYQSAQAQVEEQRKLNHLKDDFLSSVSHELRTPITTMKMALQMLAIALNRHHSLFTELSKPPSDQNKVARYFQILHTECEREISLIDDLLDLQHLEAGVYPLRYTTIQISDWLTQITEIFEERTQKRQQHLQVNIPDQLPNLFCDSVSLGRVFTELLNNACKYTPSTGIITITAEAQAETIQFNVTNSGVEIASNELPLIFNKFYRVPNVDPWKQGGTGLGLALVKRLVTHLEGTIEVESVSNQTCFTVTLPLHRPTPSA